MPASGASTSLFGSVWPPSVQLSFNDRIEARLAAVALPDEPQAGERQQVVGLVDLVAERRYRGRQAAGGDGRDLAHLLAQAPDDPVDLAGEAVHDPRLDR